jgi:hypothetical protein
LGSRERNTVDEHGDGLVAEQNVASSAEHPRDAATRIVSGDRVGQPNPKAGRRRVLRRIERALDTLSVGGRTS